MRLAALKVFVWCVAIHFLSELCTQGALQWTLHPIEHEGTNEPVWLMGVAFGNGKFLAVGHTGETYSAPASDPNMWTRGENIPDAILNTMIFADGRFAAVGLDKQTTNALFLSSSDGLNWTRRRLESPQLLRDVAYGNGHFVAIGDDILGRSTNGIDWVIDSHFVRNPTVIFQTLDFVNGEFMAMFVDERSGVVWPTKLATSVDGINWQEHGPWIPGFAHVAYGRKKYVALGKNDCIPCGSEYFSENGRNWETQGFPGNVNGLAIAYANGLFAVSSLGQPSALLSSTNGLTWDEFRIGMYDYLGAIAYGRGSFVAVGRGLIAVSDFAGGLPYISNLRVGAEAVDFEFNAEEKTEWQVEASEDLAEWRVVTEIEGNINGRQSVSVSSEGKRVRFLRVREK